MASYKDSAITFMATEQADLIEAERNQTPLGSTEIAGRTLWTLVSVGTELAAYAGGNFPCVPGYAAVFNVEELGADVTGFKAGDLAFCMGTHCSRQRVEEQAALPVPKGLKPEAAVYARMLSIGMSALATTKARPPAPVLVMGLGVVGLMTARIFESCGYKVLACEPLESRRKIAASCGVDALMAMPLDDPSLIGQVDAVIECSGHEQAALDGCRVVRKGGEVVLVGVPWERRTGLTAHDLLHEVFRRYVNLRSGWEWELPLYPTEFRSGSIYGNLAAALKWLDEGRVKVAGLHTVMSPKRAQQAYRMLREGQCEKLTVAFDWNLVIMG